MVQRMAGARVGGRRTVIAGNTILHSKQHLSHIVLPIIPRKKIFCGTCSVSGGVALDAQAGDKKLKDVCAAAGFPKARRATDTP